MSVRSREGHAFREGTRVFNESVCLRDHRIVVNRSDINGSKCSPVWPKSIAGGLIVLDCIWILQSRRCHMFLLVTSLGSNMSKKQLLNVMLLHFRLFVAVACRFRHAATSALLVKRRFSIELKFQNKRAGILSGPEDCYREDCCELVATRYPYHSWVCFESILRFLVEDKYLDRMNLATEQIGFDNKFKRTDCLCSSWPASKNQSRSFAALTA